MLDAKMPLPEDVDLECFLPVNKALRFVQLLAVGEPSPLAKLPLAQN